VLRRYLQDINTQFRVYPWEIEEERKTQVLETETKKSFDLRACEELVDFLWWKGSTHVIAQIKKTRMNQNGLEIKNRVKNEREKKKDVKNTSPIIRTKLLPNPRGHKEDLGPPFPLEFLVLTLNTWISGPLSHTSN
jgi:hypothetical protein